MSYWDKERLLRSSILAGFFAAGLTAAPAFAQEEEEEEEEQAQEEVQAPQTSDRVVVTGSLLRRNEFTSAAPIQVITSETASLEGLLDTSEILQESSIAAGSVQINTQFGGFIVNGGPGVNTVSLRGLGAQRTLLLFNGRRMGPAGVSGRVGAVDLNVIPQSVVQRIEILKDGASSIYGSDAVAGVVNVITRTEIEDPEITVTASVPFDGGGESYTIDGAIGHNFDRGFVTLSAAYNRQERLVVDDRDHFACPHDYVFDPDTGERIDRIERNPTSDRQGEFKCFNSGVVNAIDVFNNTTRRFIIDPNATDGDRAGNTFDGFRLRGTNGTANDANGVPIGILETDTDDDRLRDDDILPLVERVSVYLTGEYDVGFADVYGELLYNNRQTDQNGSRQFFPWSGNPAFFGSAGNAHLAGVTMPAAFGGTPFYARPIALIPFDTDVEVNYWHGVVGARGTFGANAGLFADWSWDTYVSHSFNDGEYSRLTVDARNTVDIFDSRSDVRHVLDPVSGDVICVRPSDGSSCPAINYFTQDFMAGNLTDEEYNFLFETDVGTTEFTQTLFNATMTGELFELPAGPVGAAFGVEYRRTEIDDSPGPLSQGDWNWGLTSAGRTQGEDSLYEAFMEVEVPLISGVPFIEDLTVNASGRVFEYDLYDTDSVYKIGANWQINEMLRLRGTYGTSFRAPALFELYLANQTGFVAQGSIDPCINWGEDPDADIRRNCAAEGIPDDYAGVGSSATVISGGGAGFLEPETSDAFTLGLIFTPTDYNLSIALDYFEIEVQDQVAQLGAGSILQGCYNSTNFPNAFCDLFERSTGGTDQFSIRTVNNNFININTQETRGLDMTLRYEHEFDFGDLLYDLQSTWTFEDTFQLFDVDAESQFRTSDFNGSIGDPDLVAQSNLRFRRGDWTFSWFTDFISRTSNDVLGDEILQNFRGNNGLVTGRFKIHTEPYFQHGASVRYSAPTWIATVGVTNIFAEEPPAISTGIDFARLGEAPLSGTQYDLRGRSAFVQIKKTF